MNTEPGELRRVRFYGAHDLAAGFYAQRVAEIALVFDPGRPPTTIVDVLELHNVQQYLENGIFLRSSTPAEQVHMEAVAPKIRAAVAKYFGDIDGSNFDAVVRDIDHEYRSDLLDLLGRGRVFERCDADIALPSLRTVGVHLGEMLASKGLVHAYDRSIRDELLVSARTAEYLVRKHLEKSAGRAIHLPPSFTPADSRGLLECYIDSEDANLNYVRLIAEAKDHAQAGIDAKLRLRARRRAEQLNSELFTEGQGVKTGVDLSISDDQEEPVLTEVDDSEGWVQRFTYSRRWLEQSLDFPSVMNNFQYLFEFVDHHVLLCFPAFPTALSAMERVMGLTGVAEYKVGRAFRQIDSRSLLQTHMYRLFLASHEIELEDVIAWFCGTYLVEEFGAQNFSFYPSAVGASNLQKVRHLFAEMESVVKQFSLFAENSELDRDLLTLGSDQVRYKEIPSLLEGKYLYSSGVQEMENILYLLFSDQSPLTYIDESLKAGNGASLLSGNQVAYATFNDYQKPYIDSMIDAGVLVDLGHRVYFANAEQLLVLVTLFRTQAASYYHLSPAGRAAVDAMVERGWMVRRSSLLTEAEADYFNYMLNRVDFSNGPNLRNRYQHGSQAGLDDSEHFNPYIVALRLMVAIVIKINDEFTLAASSGPDAGE
ncbi:MAG: hypothetical protein B5766_07300 [Candidatus Lumbricidophila eiseniae]|uniref:Uncharacterized protein n=1 Tax=Candidatus Lumbricidiphila eiseniae TaxID=1969409 RepID=A0A2A6FR20_9MICO|nr:MAG: hypothetical protein B5766_07300 [Candidatus Lumbricidophila eiseniae]